MELKDVKRIQRLLEKRVDKKSNSALFKSGYKIGVNEFVERLKKLMAKLGDEII